MTRLARVLTYVLPIIAIAVATWSLVVSYNVTPPTSRAQVTSADGGAPRPGATATTVKTPAQRERESTAAYEARTHTCLGGPEFVIGYKVYFTDGFTGSPGACVWTGSYPLNQGAFYRSVLDAESCPPGHGVVVGDASNNQGQCR